MENITNPIILVVITRVFQLHESLVESGVDKDSLPGKKLIGNKDPAFIKKRRKELETYLQSVFNFLKHSLPSCLVTFLQFPSYDLHHILRAISSSYVKVRRSALVWAINNNIIDFSNMHFCLEYVMVQGTVDRQLPDQDKSLIQMPKSSSNKTPSKILLPHLFYGKLHIVKLCYC